ncbi:MAG TPA: cytochrome c-type biogenesis protein [Candidatus Eisenbacteria bacterium]|nr:cytochrome c-type biogenesis protein [Candidatus Eisenbacteria bacterium]
MPRPIVSRQTPAFAAAVALAFLLSAAYVPAPAHANESASGKKDPARAITSQLICPCSCGEILSGCTCETGKAMQGYVDREIKAGKSKDQIEASLVNQYGEVILGAPKAKGFNLLVWVAPFAATALGFLIASLVLFRWVRQRAQTMPGGAAGGGAAGAGGAGGAGPSTTAEQDLEALRERAEAELKRFKE